MANPKFKENLTATEYVWAELNLQPSPPVKSARDFQNIDHELTDPTGKLVDVFKVTERRVWECEWLCTEAQMIELRKWWEKGSFLLYPDSGLSTFYRVIWEPATFAAEWQRGGRYRIVASLTEVQ